MIDLAQELIEFAFSLKPIGDRRWELRAYFSLEDFIIDSIQNELGYETSLSNTVEYFIIDRQIKILFKLINIKDDDIEDLEIMCDSTGKVWFAEVSKEGESIKEFKF